MSYNLLPTALQDDPATRDRLAAYAIVGTPRDAAFDRIVFTAAQMFRVPIAVVALDDGDRLWFKAQVGLDLLEVPRAISFCSEIVGEDPLVIEDASQVARLANSPFVTGTPNLRFYAGVPLITPDHVRVGSLCIADRTPKVLLSRQIWQLQQLAIGVVSMLEARRPVD